MVYHSFNSNLPCFCIIYFYLVKDFTMHVESLQDVVNIFFIKQKTTEKEEIMVSLTYYSFYKCLRVLCKNVDLSQAIY